jgi:hypothetical protein
MKIIKNLLIFLLNLSWFCEYKTSCKRLSYKAASCTHKTVNMPEGIYLTSTLNRLIFLPYLTRQAETKSCTSILD